MLWMVVLVVLIGCIITVIIYDRHLMKTQWEEADNVDAALLKETVDSSTYVNNSTNALLALEEAVRAHRTVDILIRRYGLKKASQRTGLDVEHLHKTLTRQRDRIRQHLAELAPDLMPIGDLAKFTTYVRQREVVSLEEELR